MLFVTFVLTACASVEDRYVRNIAHQYLSPKIRQLPRKDIVGVSKGKNEAVPDEVVVATAFPSGGATLYSLMKRDGRWQIRWNGEISDSLVSLVFSDP